MLVGMLMCLVCLCLSISIRVVCALLSLLVLVVPFRCLSSLFALVWYSSLRILLLSAVSVLVCGVVVLVGLAALLVNTTDAAVRWRVNRRVRRVLSVVRLLLTATVLFLRCLHVVKRICGRVPPACTGGIVCAWRTTEPVLQ